jgi:hypothetical protein
MVALGVLYHRIKLMTSSRKKGLMTGEEMNNLVLQFVF